MVRAVFFDKDGVLNKLVQRPTKKTAPWTMKELEFIDESKEAVNMVQKYGWKTFMITNQPDFGDGSAKPKDLKKILQINVDYFGFDGYTFSMDRNSNRYKPERGMVDELAKKHNIDLKHSIMIGDSWRDVVLAHNCGMKCYYIGSREDYFFPEQYQHIRPDYFITHVYAACRHITNGGAIQ
jgi:D-glycero-D-manno-heptose 1,7-bisphosphate phosphatase